MGFYFKIPVNLIAVVPCLYFLLAPQNAHASSDALENYVKKSDTSYQYIVGFSEENRICRRAPPDRKRWKCYRFSNQHTQILLTSQEWQGKLWRHRFDIILPKKFRKIRPNTHHALLILDGEEMSKEDEERLIAGKKIGNPIRLMLYKILAERLQVPVVVLHHVPPGPLFDGKDSDEANAYTIKKYLETGDAEQLLLLPMVKSVVRAMDASQDFLMDQSISIDSFIILGVSKRGLTSLLTNKIDKRITTVISISFDMLNQEEQLKHHKLVWGEYSQGIAPYTGEGLGNRISSEAGNALREIIDPYNYHESDDSKKVTKLFIIGTNDEYWPVDALNLYWINISGAKYILYIPGGRHIPSKFGRLLSVITEFVLRAVDGTALPDFRWNFREVDKKLLINIQTGQKPRKVLMWSASSKVLKKGRDFREEKFTSRRIREVDGKYSYNLDIPQNICKVIYIEVWYDGINGKYPLSTQMRVIGPSLKCVTSKELEKNLRDFP